MAVTSMLVFWVATPCELVDRYNLAEEHADRGSAFL
jgi:hypothetical protein